MSRSPCIWLTRPQDDSAALAATLEKHGIQSIIAPVMRIEAVSPQSIPSRPDAILLTSRHAAQVLHALPDDWRTLPLFTVGSATAQAAREASFTPSLTGDAGALALLPAMAAQLTPGARVLYFAGDEVSTDVVPLLGAQRITVEQVEVYRAVAETSWPERLQDALAQQRITGVAFFSARSAQLAMALLNQHGLAASAAQMEAYCLSLAVAQAAGGLPWKALHACHQPNLAAMVELMVSPRDFG